MKLSVIVVTHNSENTISKCLKSLPSDFECIVIDNASSDKTSEIVRSFPNVELINYDKNIGFGAACNQGLLTAEGEFALLLNPDAWSIENGVQKLLEFMETQPNCLAAGGRLEFDDGTIQESACSELTLSKVFLEQTFLEKLFGSPYWISSKLKHAGKVAQVMGACIMLRRTKSDGNYFPSFDQRFFLYCEDTELCKRISELGEIWYVPEARFGHSLGTSSIGNRFQAVRYYNRGKELYFSLHHGELASVICWTLNRFGALLRLLPGILTLGVVPTLRQKFATFVRVLFGPIDPYPKP